MRNRVFGPERLSSNAVGTVEFQYSENLAGDDLRIEQTACDRQRAGSVCRGLGAEAAMIGGDRHADGGSALAVPKHGRTQSPTFAHGLPATAGILPEFSPRVSWDWPQRSW